MTRIAVLCGGVGAARMLSGLVQVVEASSISAVVNTGDDTELNGLKISPDLDTITYTLAGEINGETGWGRAGETWHAMEELERLGGEERVWFRLGDRDLGTHLYRTARLLEGATLTEVTGEIAERFHVGVRLLPMSDAAVRTVLELPDGSELSFQEYFVKWRHDVVVSGVRFEGSERAMASEAALGALDEADLVVIAPSNPIVSIGPILSLAGMRELLSARRTSVVAVSPIVAGRALKGPADRLLAELGGEASAVGVARVLTAVAGTLVLDTADAALATEVEEEGMHAVVTGAVMVDPAAAARLAAAVVECCR